MVKRCIISDINKDDFVLDELVYGFLARGKKQDFLCSRLLHVMDMHESLNRITLVPPSVHLSWLSTTSLLFVANFSIANSFSAPSSSLSNPLSLEFSLSRYLLTVEPFHLLSFPYPQITLA